MTGRRQFLCAGAAAMLAATGVSARPVFIAETPGHTRFFIDDATIADLASPDGPIRQAKLRTVSAPGPTLVKGQVAAESIMQFRCGSRRYRQIQTIAIYKDGSRHLVVPPSATRAFSETGQGSFEGKVLAAVCELQK